MKAENEISWAIVDLKSTGLSTLNKDLWIAQVRAREKMGADRVIMMPAVQDLHSQKGEVTAEMREALMRADVIMIPYDPSPGGEQECIRLYRNIKQRAPNSKIVVIGASDEIVKMADYAKLHKDEDLEESIDAMKNHLRTRYSLDDFGKSSNDDFVRDLFHIADACSAEGYSKG